MGTGHAEIGIDEIKNLRTDCVHDDGSPFVVTNGEKYWLQNTGQSVVSVCERATTRGVPSLTTDDAVLLVPFDSLRINVESGEEYFAWSLNAPSRIAVNEE